MFRRVARAPHRGGSAHAHVRRSLVVRHTNRECTESPLLLSRNEKKSSLLKIQPIDVFLPLYPESVPYS